MRGTIHSKRKPCTRSAPVIDPPSRLSWVTAGNPREHPPEQIEQIAASMREFGWTIPVLLDELGEIIAGHGRVLAAPPLGWTEAQVTIARGWSEAQKCAYHIAEPFLAPAQPWSPRRAWTAYAWASRSSRGTWTSASSHGSN